MVGTNLVSSSVASLPGFASRRPLVESDIGTSFKSLISFDIYQNSGAVQVPEVRVRPFDVAPRFFCHELPPRFFTKTILKRVIAMIKLDPLTEWMSSKMH